MVYKFLVHENADIGIKVSFEAKWSLLPVKWRRFWREEFSHMQMDGEDGEEVGAFVDMSEEYSMALDVIEKNRWSSLSKCLDKHYAYPEVRCPWGCSEYLPKCNQLPFETFLWYFTNYELSCYFAPSGKSWVDCMSPSYPSSCLILEHFRCSPVVVMSDFGPMILCCRNHSENCTQRYVHVPESPSGTIYTPNANSYAPVVLRPRAHRTFKTNHFSDTYQTVAQVGGFSGVDGNYITGSHRSSKTDGLATLRDCIAAEGRPDIRSQILDRCIDKSAPGYIPLDQIQRFLSYAEEVVPDRATSYPECLTSTYISAGTAMKLQQSIYDDGSTSITVYDEGQAAPQQCLFIPPWPTFFVHIHSMDGYGQRPHRIVEQEIGLWILLCMVSQVPELWESVSMAVTDNKRWYGHFLRHASAVCKFRGKVASSSYFKTMKKEKLYDLWESPLKELLACSDGMKSLFSGCHNVGVVDHYFASPWDVENDIIICIDPMNHQIQGYELRLLIFMTPKMNDDGVDVSETDRKTWRMFVRHAGMKFWYQNGDGYPTKYDGPDLHAIDWNGARLAVYCKKEDPSKRNLKRRYLEIIGGQSYVCCALHGTPLILNHEKNIGGECVRKCICKRKDSNDSCYDCGLPKDSYGYTDISGNGACNQFASYVCPHYRACKTGICQDHLSEAKRQCSLMPHKDASLYLSKTFSFYNNMHTYDQNDYSAVIGTGEDYDNAHTTQLGPTSAHEIPQDMLDDDDLDSNAEYEFLGDTDAIPDDVSDASSDSLPPLVSRDDYEYTYADDEDMNQEEDNEEDQEAHAKILCTRAGTHQLDIDVQHYDKSGSKIPLYVILNQHGHLLTRTQAKLRMTKLHRSLCENIVSRCRTKVVPLVYAEAQLFPTVFWQSLEDGTIAGALPTALWSDAGTLKRLGIATMRDHCKNRITNPALMTSTHPGYHFLLMDKVVNLGLRGKDTRIILHRGFADNQGEDGIKFREKSDAAELYGEASENHANVHKLSALVREKEPHFFFTQSCNHKTCRGLRVLREWITSHEAHLQLAEKYGLELEEAERYLRESAASYVLRSWNEVIDLWMRYIIYSPEEPLGKIEYAWYRKEFQETQGNVSHIHAILRTVNDISMKEQRDIVMSKIRGCLSELFHNKDFDELHENDIISSKDHVIDLLNDAKSYLTHHCHARCQIVRRDKDGTTEFYCKVKDNYYRTLTPAEHSIVPIKAFHTPQAQEIYNRLGMMEGDQVTEECLKADCHIPVSNPRDSKMSPTNPHLFACFPSMQNLQFTTGATISAYLVKYCVKMDEVARAILKVQRRNEPEVAPAIVESLNNTKITSNKIHQEKKRGKLNDCGRILTQMESLTVLLGGDLVTSTVEFIQIPTSPREYRPAFYKRRNDHTPQQNATRIDDYITNGEVLGQEVRIDKGFPSYRLFSDYQMEVIKDEQSSPLTIDAITVFSIRPPEIRFVNAVRLYFKWFERHVIFRGRPQTIEEKRKSLFDSLDLDLFHSAWIDGMNYRVRLRKGAIGEILNYAYGCDESLFGSRQAKANMLELLKQLHFGHLQYGNPGNREVGMQTRRATMEPSRSRYTSQSIQFLSFSDTLQLPTPWTTAVYPRNRGRFLVHILLLFGRFETEYELMLQGTMKRAYAHAGLFDTARPRESLDELLCRYVRECLAFESGSTNQHDKNLVQAEAAFTELLLEEERNGDEEVFGTPCVLQSRMKENSNDKVVNELQRLIHGFIDTLYIDLVNAGIQELPPMASVKQLFAQPTTDAMMTGTEHSLDYAFPPPHNDTSPQSLASYTEQCEVIETAKNNIARYLSGKSHKNLIVCGGPGNGKTTVCQEICLYALSKGMKGIATSIVADRSKALGGMHIHLLCSLTAGDRNNLSPGRAADTAAANIYRKPELLYFWQNLDFIYIDELGAVSAELMATIDIVARHVKRSSRFMGGMLVLSSIDIHQLLPFVGTPMLLSMNMMTEFTFSELNESVRAAKDPNLRRICQLTRTTTWNDEKRQEFRNLLKANCNFVQSFDDPAIPRDAIFVFGRKAPCQKIEDLIVRKMRQSNATVIMAEAYDEESSTAGNWRGASPAASRMLSQKVKTKKELFLFERGRYEFTYNLRGQFQQGQLAILLSIDRQDVEKEKSIQFFKGPPGCKEFPSIENFNEEYLLSNGWEKVWVPFEASKPTRIWGNLFGRRHQYGVRLRVASTIHASMGSTYGTLVTAVSPVRAHRDLDFALWETAQVVVLVSRTRLCSDIYFVGKPDEVVNHLLSVLDNQTRYLPHIKALTLSLCQSTTATTPLIIPPPVFRPCDVVVDKIPAVYLLVSTKHLGYMYIGETMDVRKRLNEHNSGDGSKFTNNERLRPWALFGYVYGFGSRINRKNFEQTWKYRAHTDRSRNRTLRPDGLMQIALQLASERNRRRPDDQQLKVQQCGTIQTQETNTNFVIGTDS